MTVAPEGVKCGNSMILSKLLHRMGSAILEAKRFHTDVALCIVQSFGPINTGWLGCIAFCKVFGGSALPDQVVRLGAHDGITFYAVWIGN